VRDARRAAGVISVRLPAAPLTRMPRQAVARRNTESGFGHRRRLLPRPR